MVIIYYCYCGVLSYCKVVKYNQSLSYNYAAYFIYILLFIFLFCILVYILCAGVANKTLIYRYLYHYNNKKMGAGKEEGGGTPGV